MFRSIVKYLLVGVVVLLFAFGVMRAGTMHQYGADMDIKMQIATNQQVEFAVGNLGGVMAKIPRKCVSDGVIEYDAPSSHTKGKVSDKTDADSVRNFSSFGIEVRLPDLLCMENEELRRDRKEKFLQPDNPWIHITVISGKDYPSTGKMAITMLANPVKQSVMHPTKFWFANYEKLPEDIHGLKAYVVTGLNPHTGRPARESEDDVYIHESEEGMADTYIACGKSKVVPGEVAWCEMSYIMEPLAKVDVRVHFSGARLPQWRHIREVSFNLLSGYLVGW